MLARTNVTVDTLGTYAAYYTTPAITNFTCQACPVRGGGDEGGARGGGVACWAALARRMPSLRPSPHPSPHLPTPRAQPNTYAPTTALSSCSLCAAGSSTVAEGAAICIPCGPGSYSPTPAVTCMLAPAGYYVNITGGVGGWGGWLGEWVGKGGGCARVGASRSARLGQASPLLTLTHPPLHSRAPPPCAGATSYAACTPGSYAGSPGSDSCDKCSAGSFADQMASKVCKACPAGFWSQSVRAPPLTPPPPPLLALRDRMVALLA